jgi:hypothetical protein
VGKLVIVAGGIAVILRLTSHSLVRATSHTKVADALIIIVPCAVVAVLLEIRSSRKKANRVNARGPATRSGYGSWRGNTGRRNGRGAERSGW